MGLRRKPLDPERMARIVAEARRGQDLRAKSYRDQALNLFPHVCARCGREFSGKDLRELTVHHKDSDHMNNPPDGSNWELLCVYCHDDEHVTPEQRGHYEGSPLRNSGMPALGFNAFEGLKNVLPPESPREDTPSEDAQ